MSVLTFLGPYWLFLGLELGSTTVFGSTYVVEQLSFSLFLSILTFDSDLISGSFLTFWGHNRLFLGLEKDSKTVLGSNNVVEQLSFSMLSSILTNDFDLIFG